MARTLAVPSRPRCGVLTDDRVACWGFDSDLLLGAPVPEPANYAAYVLRSGGADLLGAKQVSASLGSSCAAMNDGKVYCWGVNDHGALGVGDAEPRDGAVEVPGLSNIEQVTVGATATCALDTTGQVYCWGLTTSVGLEGGLNQEGEPGDYPYDDPDAVARYFTTPQALPTLTDAVEVKCGNGTEVVCWGANSSRQLGDGTKILRDVPTPTAPLEPG